MIRLTRPPTPEVLTTKGAQKAKEHCAAHEASVRDFEFDSDIYGHRSVKDALVAMNSRKCSFCESEICHVHPGTIDHFRPKTAVQQEPGDPLQRPGYYWLAYEWENLLLSCPICNQYFKRNLFPLKNPAQRAKDHLHDLAAEQPLLIDPSKEEPKELIGFHQEILFAVDDNIRGKTTIDILKLNDRYDLTEKRRKLLKLVSFSIALRKLAPDSIERANADRVLQEMNQDGEYLAMLRTAFPNDFRNPPDRTEILNFPVDE